MKYNGIANLQQPGNRQGNMASHEASFGAAMSPEKMQRVSKTNPCPVCGKPDWCLYTKDGSATICQRIEENSKKRCGDAGFLHILTERPQSQQFGPQRKFTVSQDNRPDRDFTALQQQYSRQITHKQFDDLSQRLGVSKRSLKRLCVGWDGKAYAFPMSNAQGQIIGIRRRFPNGNKVSVTGSKTGLFIPTDLSPEGPLLICEGATDTTAGLDLGFEAVGRPNCNSKVKMTARLVKGRHVVIISDNDPPKEDGRQPGNEGAIVLANKLVFVCPSVRMIFPPAKYKDIRGWYNSGLKRDELLTNIENAKPLTVELK
jgi:hypothetical protein